MNCTQYKNYEHHFGYDLLPDKARRLSSYGYEKPKIPLNRTKLQRQFKDNHWAKNLHSQSAQFIIGEVINAYKSWFAHRKNGRSEGEAYTSGNSNPPGFRPKANLSPVTFVQGAPALFNKNGKTYLRLSLGTKREG